MGTFYQFTVGEAERGLRLDLLLTRHLPREYSRTQVQRVIKLGRVALGDHPAKPHHLVHAGDVITVRWTATAAPPVPRTLRPEPIPLEVVYEDEALLVVNKPAGLVTHPAPGHWTGTLVNAVLWHLQHAVSSFKFQVSSFRFQVPSRHLPSAHDALAHLRPGIVHRLDKDTSGLLIIAKRPEVQWALQKQMAQRLVRRTYVAVVAGWVRQEAGTIDAPIGRHPKDRKRMAVLQTGGRRAVTHFRVLQRRKTRNPEPGTRNFSVLEVTLETGRTHQIRVHLASRGHPVVGDPVYGHRSDAGAGLLLHARLLRFAHPVTKQTLELSSPLPSNIRQFVASLDDAA